MSDCTLPTCLLSGKYDILLLLSNDDSSMNFLHHFLATVFMRSFSIGFRAFRAKTFARARWLRLWSLYPTACIERWPRLVDFSMPSARLFWSISVFPIFTKAKFATRVFSFGLFVRCGSSGGWRETVWWRWNFLCHTWLLLEVLFNLVIHALLNKSCNRGYGARNLNVPPGWRLYKAVESWSVEQTLTECPVPYFKNNFLRDYVPRKREGKILNAFKGCTVACGVDVTNGLRS